MVRDRMIIKFIVLIIRISIQNGLRDHEQDI